MLSSQKSNVMLNYILFLLITAAGIGVLAGKSRTLYTGLSNEPYVDASPMTIFWILVFSTGILAFSSPGGIDLMAVRLFMVEILGLLSLLLARSKAEWSVPLTIYSFYLAWIMVGIIYSHAAAYGVRVFLKYLLPLIVVLMGSSAVKTPAVWLKCVMSARWMGVISLVYYLMPFSQRYLPGLFWYFTAGCINYISLVAMSMSLVCYSDEKLRNFIWCVLFVVPPFLWSLRTSMAGMIMAVSACVLLRYRVKALPVIACVLLAGLIAVFSIRQVREKMFVDPEAVSIGMVLAGDLSYEDINTNARRGMWTHLEEKFCNDAPLTGHGTGTVQHYMYTHNLFRGLKVPHNDYLQIRCDNGYIGMWIYLSSFIGAILHSFWIYFKSTEACMKVISMSAGVALSGVIFTLFTENCVNYSLSTLLPPWGLYGMMIGIWRNTKS